jgi:serine/threonine protein kinase
MLLDEGGYGCVYTGLCHKNKDISKVVNTYHAKREIVMSNLVKKIPDYKKYFVPIESYCIIKSKSIKRCSALDEETNYVALNLPFIDTVNLKIEIPQYIKLVQSISKLLKRKIVHFDLKEDNVLFNPEPLIIDFGLSFSMKKKNQMPPDFFSYSPRHYEIPIDVHLLCFLKKNFLTMETLENVCKEVYMQSPFLENPEECVQYYSYLVGLTKEEMEWSLLKGWKTWDIYSATIMLFANVEIPELRRNLHPNPSMRLSPRMTVLVSRKN